MAVLYHASPIKSLKTINPSKTLSGDKYIGDYIFATKNIKLAVMYLATKGIATLMNADTSEAYIVINSDYSNYLRNDRGGAIYLIPDNSFTATPQKNLEAYELVSKVQVEPVDKKIFKRSVDAFKKFNIKVYFVNDEIFNKLVKAKNETVLLKELVTYA